MNRLDRKSLALARKFKNSGGTRDKYVEVKTDVINRTALAEGWRASERAMALTHVNEIATKVWGAK